MPGSSQTDLLIAAVEGLHQAVTLIRQSPTHLATARQALQHLDANTLDTLRELHTIFTAPEGATPPAVLDWQGDPNLPLIVPSPILPPGLDISQPSDYYALSSPDPLAPADAQRVGPSSPDVPPSVVSIPSNAGESERVCPQPTATTRRRSRPATQPVAPTPTPRTTFLLNICYYGAGVQVCDRQPSVRRVVRLIMYQHATTGLLSNRIACRWRPVPMLSIYHIRYSDNNKLPY
jgi:hypothetical protein